MTFLFLFTIPLASAALSLQSFQRAVASAGFPSPPRTIFHGFQNAFADLSYTPTRAQLAMFLAQCLHESDGLRATTEYACASGCPGRYVTPLDVPGKQYYGRGFIQLTWAYNYKAASDALFSNPQVLLDDPDRVAKDLQLAWSTAAWFWVNHVVPQAPGLNFGATTRVINGGIECNGYSSAARKRWEIFQNVARVLGIDNVSEAGCY